MKQSRLIQKAKRFMAGVIALAMTVTMFPVASAAAEEPQEKYPYTLFAASEADGAITITGNACVNGNIATNGTAVVTGSAINVNGSITEQVNEKMINISAKLDELYFAGENVENYAENYVSEDVNCNVSNPTVVMGTMEVKGNVNLNAPVKVSENITLQTDSLNANNVVLYSENGDISIFGNNVNFTGLLYAPEGEVKIQAQHVNLNSIIVIADTITLETGNANTNYNQNMAEIVGVTSGEETTEPDKEPTVLYLLGKYNEENHSIDMEWYTNATETDVMVWTSEDNVTYENAATVTGETAYQYVIAEEFETKYFKASVMDEQGESVETVPFVVVKSENGYSLSALDSDGDGVADEYELLVGTDVNSPDTDGDTLTDYEELYISQTDATKFDSVTEGLSDAEADSDGDKLSNCEEIEFATDVQDADTDNDNLTDYEEIAVYNTDPLKDDTDGDTLKDGDEIALGLDPLNPMTFGVPDAEYTLEQTISADSEVLEEINTDENEYRLAVDVTASGYVEGNLTAKETGYAAAIKNEFMVGIASELSYTNEDGIESVTLTFELDDEVIGDSLDLFPGVEELSGIKRFNVFKYFEERNMLLPIETVVDEENNRIYATTDDLGTYCVMDMERWLASFEVPEEVYMDAPVMFSMRPEVSDNETADEKIIIDCIGTPQDMELVDLASADDESVEEDALVDAPMMFALKNAVDKTPVDVVFLLQSSGQLENTFINQKTMIYELLDDLNFKYGRGNVRFAVISYNLSGAEFLTSFEGDIWFTTTYDLRRTLNNLEYEYTSGYTDRGNAFEKLQDEVQFKENAAKFIFQIMNGATSVGNAYFDQINTCAKLGINYSELGPEGYGYANPTYGQQVADAIASTNGMNATFGTYSLLEVYNHIVTYAAPPQMEFDAIVPSGWKRIVLDGILDAENGVNSDTDELTDWEEVNTELISWDTDGTVILPTIQDCITQVDDAYARDGLKRYRESVYDREDSTPGMPTSDFLKYLDYVINNTHILPIHSDPTEADTDGDGLGDFLDNQPLDSLIHSFLIYETVKCDEEIKSIKPEDYTYGDKTKSQLRDMKKISWIDFAGYNKEKQYLSDMKRLMKTFSKGDMQKVALDMVDNFASGTGADYRNDILDAEVKKHQNTKTYVDGIRSIIDNYIIEHNGDISGLIYTKERRENGTSIMVNEMVNNEVYQPVYDDKFSGLGITVDSLYGNQVEITSYHYDSNTNSFEYTLHFTMYDIFGLDSADVTRKAVLFMKYGDFGGFAEWYILQHYDEYKGKYVPFITYIEFTE